jgi:hypothetical protein
MMTKNLPNEREQLEMLTIDQLVPQEHLVRKLSPSLIFRSSNPWLKIFIQALVGQVSIRSFCGRF